MTEKIEWYKEVLDLEPNSKVFFPLAKLLTEALREEEAVAVLEQGLARHEEFLEARLFLIDLLYKAGQREACEAQVGKLSKLFAAYAGFWQAWAACLGSSGQAPDTAAVLRFLALCFTHGSVPLHAVLDQGVASFLARQHEASAIKPERHELGQSAPVDAVTASEPLRAAADAMAAAVSHEPHVAPHAVTAESASHESHVDPHAAMAEPVSHEPHFDPHTAMADDAALPDGSGNGADSAFSASALTAVSALAAPVAAAPHMALEDIDEGEERFSLRTRSMAEVLAEQGDVRGALDIYHELSAAAVHPEESADLRQRIATLNARLGSAQPVEQGQTDAPLASSSGKDKLISMLEALAERVEARAHS